ncbi:hypothetical protein ACHAXR_006491 [Thalassiosira sp. AJA248-18]
MSVFINNVDDYLGPSQACVNPLFTAPPKSAQSNNDANPVKDSDKKNGSVDKISSKNGTKATAGSKVIQRSRRIRQRRAPRIIQSEESDDSPVASAPNASREPIRLDHYKNDEEYQDATPSINADTSTTTQTIKKKATVTLSDCLSCSGCVTSAEAVLMSHHSIDTLREVVSISQTQQQQQKKIMFTISSASLADIYRHLYLEAEARENNVSGDILDGNNESLPGNSPPSRHEFLAKIADFLHSEFGAEMVIDGALSQRISLMESASEFCYRHKKTQQSRGEDKKDEAAGDQALTSEVTSEKSIAAAMPSVAVSSTKTRFINKQDGSDESVDEDTLMEVTTLNHPPGRLIEEDGSSPLSAPRQISPIQPTSLPMLASSCPGFVCLVEKTAPTAVPLLSSAKSPMAVAGTLLKTGQCNLNNQPITSESLMGKDLLSRSDILVDGNGPCYHVAIMPCHDKKLEAGRGDLAWEQQALLQYGNASKSSVDKGKSLKSRMSVDGVSGNEAEDLVNEVDLVLTTGELLEVLSEAATKLNDGGTSSLTAQQLPGTLENNGSNIFAIRSFLSRSGLAHASCALMTLNTDNQHNDHEKNDGDNNLELDTGVHGSGSYADFIFRYAARELFGCKLARDKPLPWKSSSSAYGATSTAGNTSGVIRRRRRRQDTTDLREITLYEHSDGSYSCSDEMNDGGGGDSSKPVLRFATAYGFKNVQLILQSLSKTNPSKTSNGYDYVEIMACPSGCSNGGGQIGAQGRRETPREAKERVKKTVSAVPIIRPQEECCGSMANALCGCDTQGFVNDSILDSEYFGESARQLFHTRFHVVPKLELSTGATAGVAVSDTKW